jgi:alkylhydroperoxidase family enzyme
MSYPTSYEGALSIPLPDAATSRANFESVIGQSYDPDATLNVVKAFPGTEGMFAGVIGLVAKIFGPEGIDDARNRQLIILRVAKALDAPYEWQVNAAMARNAGLSEEELRAAESDGPVTGIAAEYVLVCTAADELSRSKTLTDETLAALLDRFGETLTRKYVLSIAFFNMIGLWLNGNRVPLETTDKIGTNTSPLG